MILNDQHQNSVKKEAGMRDDLQLRPQDLLVRSQTNLLFLSKTNGLGFKQQLVTFNCPTMHWNPTGQSSPSMLQLIGPLALL